jgi:hypothetical protein
MRIYHPAFQADVQAAVEVLPDDPDAQVAHVISRMAQYVREDASDADVMQDAAQAVQGDPIADVFWHVKQKLSFLRDEALADPILSSLDSPHPVAEILIRPRDMAVMCADGSCQRMGDCDDYVMYGAALLKALGYDPRFVTIAADGADRRRFSHVYLVVYGPDGSRIPLDISHGAYPGWEAPNFYRKKEWPIGAGGLESFLLAGLVLGVPIYLLSRAGA